MSRKKKEVLEGEVAVAQVESRHDKFVRLANRRVNKALKMIEYVSNLGNRSAYEYSEAEADAIINAVFKATESMTARFRQPKQQARLWDLLLETEK